MKTGRFKKAEVYLSPEVHLALQQMANSYEVYSEKAMRAQIILLSASGLSNKAIAQQLGLSRKTIAIWRNRYLEQGDAGLYGKHLGRRRKYETQEEAIEQTKKDRSFSFFDFRLRPQRIHPFNLNKFHLSIEKTIRQGVSSFINLPDEASEKKRIVANPDNCFDRIIRIGALFAGKSSRLIQPDRVKDTLRKCFILTRALNILDANCVPYTFNDKVLRVHIVLPGKLDVCFWPTSGKWIDYLSNPSTQPCIDYGLGVLAVITWYQQQNSHHSIPSNQVRQKEERKKERRQKASEIKKELVEETIRLLSEAGLDYSSKNSGYNISVKGPGETRILLWPSSGHWRIVGDSKNYSGTPHEFLAWYFEDIKCL